MLKLRALLRASTFIALVVFILIGLPTLLVGTTGNRATLVWASSYYLLPMVLVVLFVWRRPESDFQPFANNSNPSSPDRDRDQSRNWTQRVLGGFGLLLVVYLHWYLVLSLSQSQTYPLIPPALFKPETVSAYILPLSLLTCLIPIASSNDETNSD